MSGRAVAVAFMAGAAWGAFWWPDGWLLALL